MDNILLRATSRHGLRRFASFLAGAVGAVMLVALALAPAPSSAQVKTGFPDKRGFKLSDFPRVVPIADGVYGYEDIRAPGFTTVSLIVVGKDGVLIADGQESPQAMTRLLVSIAHITDKPVKWYVVGSNHPDHTGGNSVLPSNVTYIVHHTSRDQLVLDAAAAATKPGAYPVVVPPVAMTSDTQTVDVGDKRVEVMFRGRAHTGGDLMVYLPAQKILFMSEVYFNRVFPAMRSAFPTEWVTVVDKALTMDVNRYVAGHGFIEEPARSREQLVEFRECLLAVIAEATRLHQLGLSPDDAMKQANWGPYGDWMLADSQRLIAIKKVYEELDGKLPK
jgi:glyoxylase-like metal-dependent hydrolase (beta-lactamase superfamily II)